MTSRIRHKRSSTLAAAPLVADLQAGELAINSRDGRLFTRINDGSDRIITLGAEMSPAIAAALKETSGAAFLTAIGASLGYSNYQLFTSDGTFNTPAGVTKVRAIVIGGGGGGGGARGDGTGGRGGYGGFAAKAEVTVSGAMAVTVGTGGAGQSTEGVAGSAGGTSSFSGLSATGGAGGQGVVATVGTPGANGTGTGGDVNGNINGIPKTLMFDGLDTLKLGLTALHLQSSGVRDDLNLTAIAYSLGGTLYPGSGGRGDASTLGSGGIGGAVFLFW